MRRICLPVMAAILLTALLWGCAANQATPTDPLQTAMPTETVQQTASSEVTEQSTVPETTQPEPFLVVIDAGHQAKGNPEKEPVGPGATEMKAKVASGTTGNFTGIPEHELNLAVAQMLQQLLEERGYEVVMIRTTHNVDISNAQRAEMANALNADAFVRIHANSSDDSSVHGILTICQTESNPYNGELYARSKALSQLVLDAMVDATGAKKRNVWETDTMSGVNWCQVPVTIVEMGFMSNEEEDRLMATEEYRQLLAQGIANGIDDYFRATSPFSS